MPITSGPTIEWKTASPLWNTLIRSEDTIGGLQSPALLHFQSDSFMQDLINLLQAVPPNPQPGDQFQRLLARRESFRELLPGEPGPTPPPPPQLKLYQPIHGSFNLVAANLVCHLPGLPDRVVNTAQGEKVGFVLRRIGSGPGQPEMAWIKDSTGSGTCWKPLTPGMHAQVFPYEEVLPMFPLNFVQDGKRRRLLVGLIPTSSRESFQAPGDDPALPTPFSTQEDARLDQVRSEVIDAIRALRTYHSTVSTTPEEEESSTFILLDFALFLAAQLPVLWQALTAPGQPAPTGDTAALYQLLTTHTIDGTNTWQTALLNTWDSRATIIAGGPPAVSYNLKGVIDADVGPPPAPDTGTLQAALQTALGAPPDTLPANLPTVPKLDTGVGALYVLRCVYQRPRCGPLQPDVVSAPTAQFALAPIFDPDAPARPIRISMPVDTSIAGLRKFKKNVAFVISDKLRQQMESVSDLNETMKGNVGTTSFNLGAICSFSIPIITICALVVLLMFLLLLNIVFWWLPFFRICFPFSLKAKGN